MIVCIVTKKARKNNDLKEKMNKREIIDERYDDIIERYDDRINQ